MEEFENERDDDVRPDQVKVKMDSSNFSWGYKVSQESADKDGDKKEEEKHEAKFLDLFKDKKDEALSVLNKFKTKIDAEDKNILTDVNLDMKRGDLLVVIGQVGSGKTSLLYSVLGETICTKNEPEVVGSIAYVEQEPYILPDTVKANILFGKTYDEERFNMAIQVS